jgi:hypothetical protein
VSVFVYYQLKETLANGSISCNMTTREPIQALGDLLLKVRRPITGHVNRSLWLTTISIGLESRPVLFISPAMFHLVVVVVCKDTGEYLYKVELLTNVSKEPVKLGIHAESNASYKKKSYLKPLSIIMERLSSWSNDDTDVAKTLCCFAATDPDHPFWHDQDYLTMGSGLHRALSDETFSMF